MIKITAIVLSGKVTLMSNLRIQIYVRYDIFFII